jgi:hypothetical protein
MRAPSNRLKVIALLWLLPAGAIVLFLLAGQAKHRYDNSGFGSFHGLVQATLVYSGPDHSFSVKIAGESAAQWHWISPRNYQYRYLDIEWSGEAGEGKGQIDTSSMTLTSKDKSLPVSRSSLSELLFGTSVNTEPQGEVDAVEFIERKIAEAGQGRLVLPRHHYYHFETPVSGIIAHFSLGARFPYSLYWWTAAWALLCLWIAFRTCRKRAMGSPLISRCVLFGF